MNHHSDPHADHLSDCLSECLSDCLSARHSDDRPVFRCHYRAQLAQDCPPGFDEAVSACMKNARRMIADGKMMTAALYPYGRQLFLYYEPVGESFRPERFMDPMTEYLNLWPQKEETLPWAQMHHIYWHNVPRGEADWRRPRAPERRRGRIAYLKPETMFRYVYHHVAIVEEGLLEGDRYQSIALHEDVLFSYFEEPKTMSNILRDSSRPSHAIQGWMDVDPESHFIHLPGSEGQNFLLLDPLFAVGEE